MRSSGARARRAAGGRRVRTALEVAARWDLIDEPPTIKCERQPKQAEPEVYTEAEVAALIDAAAKNAPDALAMVLPPRGIQATMAEFGHRDWIRVEQ